MLAFHTARSQWLFTYEPIVLMSILSDTPTASGTCAMAVVPEIILSLR
jgi:hypothetical protein